MNPADTIVAISSPPGPATRGIVRVSGATTRDVVAAVLPEWAWQRGASHAAVQLTGWPGVPALVLAFRAPRSYTGDDLVELHVPGSPPLLEALVAELLAAGDAVRAAGPGEFTLRAVLNGRLDVAQAEAIGELIATPDPGAATALAGQLVAGRVGAPTGLVARATAWREQLGQMLARTELALDFSEDEDLTYVADPPRLSADLRTMRDELVELAGRVDRGRAGAGDRADVVLAGPANAGKSSLFNALLGEQRAIVTRHAGTTRDALASEPADLPIRLWDTAGLSDAAGADATGTDRQAEALAQTLAGNCDLLLWCWPADVAPVGYPPLPPDTSWQLVRTKADLPAAWSDPAVAASSVLPDGTAGMRDTIRNRLAGLPEWRGGSFASARQAAHLAAAASALSRAIPLAAGADTLELAAAEMGAADRELALLLGVEPATGVASEVVLHRIFAGFCVGK